MANETTPATKTPMKSKTAWVMAIAFVAGFIPVAQEWIEQNPVKVFQALAAIGVLLRFVTSGKLKIFSDDDDVSGSSSSGGSGPLGGNANGSDNTSNWFSPSRKPAGPWLVAVACAVVFLFTGCTQQQLEAFRAVPITFGVESEHGTYSYSSKGGLSVAVKIREEKSAVDFGAILEREWEAGRYEPSPIPVPVEVWPPVERRPRRMVLP